MQILSQNMNWSIKPNPTFLMLKHHPEEYQNFNFKTSDVHRYIQCHSWSIS